MNGFLAFLGKEFREIFRTWRIWVIPGITVFFALTGPVLARFTPEIVGSLMAGQSAGVTIELPDPTYVDAYLQWTKNLSQIVLFAVIIVCGGLISAEKKAGTASIVLTKPLSRSSFVLAKFIAASALLIASSLIGALLTWGVTYAVFDEAPFAELARATGVWLVFALLFVAFLELLSASMDSQSAAVGLGFGAYALLGIGALWEPALRYSPCGLLGAPTEIVTGAAESVLWPVVASLVLAFALVALAVAIFRCREL